MTQHQSPRWTMLVGILLSVALNAAGQICFKAARMAQPDASVVALFWHRETGGASDLWAVGGVLALGPGACPIVSGVSHPLSHLPYRTGPFCCLLCRDNHAPALGRCGRDCSWRFTAGEDMTGCKCSSTGYSSLEF